MARLTSAAIACLAGALSGSTGAFAADEAAAPAEEVFPYVELELETTLGDDFTFRSDDPGAEINDLFPEGALSVKIGLTRVFSINAGLTLEPVRDPEPFEDRVFRDIGLYVDTLNLQADVGDLSLVAGKFGPGFGRAWDNTPGIYGTSFAEDYELSEQIGLGAAYAFTGAWGTHTLGANVFFADTTALSDSLFARRGRLSTADGGAGNTGRLDNVSLTLDGGEFATLPGFSYHLGYRRLSPGDGDAAAEHGFVAGLAQETELSGGSTLGLNGEVAHFVNQGGGLDDVTYLTGGASLANGPWHGELAASLRRVAFDGGGGRSDALGQVSGGYTFDNGIDVSFGYAVARAEDVTSHTLGLRLAKTFSYSSR